MGQLSCNRCGAKAEGDTQEQADALIDHARGKMIGRPCGGAQADLVWDGATIPISDQDNTKPELQPGESVTSDSLEEKPKKQSKRR